MDNKHILIVDDDISMLKMLRMFLQDEFKVSVVDSGKLALEFVSKHIPDLILLDYLMPVLSGPEVLENLREKEEYKDIPVLFLTSVTDREKIVKCLSMNPKGYLVKPISREELLDKVRASVV